MFTLPVTTTDTLYGAPFQAALSALCVDRHPSTSGDILGLIGLLAEGEMTGKGGPVAYDWQIMVATETGVTGIDPDKVADDRKLLAYEALYSAFMGEANFDQLEAAFGNLLLPGEQQSYHNIYVTPHALIHSPCAFADTVIDDAHAGEAMSQEIVNKVMRLIARRPRSAHEALTSNAAAKDLYRRVLAITPILDPLDRNLSHTPDLPVIQWKTPALA